MMETAGGPGLLDASNPCIRSVCATKATVTQAPARQSLLVFCNKLHVGFQAADARKFQQNFPYE